MCFPQRSNFIHRFLSDSQEQPQKPFYQNEAYRARSAISTSRNHPPDGKHAARSLASPHTPCTPQLPTTAKGRMSSLAQVGALGLLGSLTVLRI